jgi:hypothetical protein
MDGTISAMTESVAGTVIAFFLYDVGDEIDLGHVRTLIETTTPAALTTKVTASSQIQYQQPPLIIDGTSIGTVLAGDFRCRIKAFDYGVVSVALTRGLPDTWPALLQEGRTWHDSLVMGATAEQVCRTFVNRIAPAMTRPRATFLLEDYLVFALTQVDGSADQLLTQHGQDIAQLLRAEQAPLSGQEREEVLRNRISYLANDLVIPTWNAALVYDTETGAQETLELLEYANSQLLQFRYYDQLLDTELGRIYAQMQTHGWARPWLGRRYTRAAHNVHSLFIDVNELTDKTENALKFAGDVYFARVFALAAARLGLDRWKASVREKLQTLDDIYRFAVEQTAMARGEFLEIAIVAILVLELVLFFAGIMK